VLLARARYLPREWAEDPARGAAAGMPTPATRCLPKPPLGKQLLARAFAAGVTATWVPADRMYGGAYTLRHSREERAPPYVLAVPSTQRVGLPAKAEHVVAAGPAEAWQRLSAGAGSQGPRWYDIGFVALVVLCTGQVLNPSGPARRQVTTTVAESV
jgi:SRSO17 transposase